MIGKRFTWQKKKWSGHLCVFPVAPSQQFLRAERGGGRPPCAAGTPGSLCGRRTGAQTWCTACFPCQCAAKPAGKTVIHAGHFLLHWHSFVPICSLHTLLSCQVSDSTRAVWPLCVYSGQAQHTTSEHSNWGSSNTRLRSERQCWFQHRVG